MNFYRLLPPISLAAFSLVMFFLMGSFDAPKPEVYKPGTADLSSLRSIKQDNEISESGKYILHVFSMNCKWCRIDFHTIKAADFNVPVYGLLYNIEEKNSDFSSLTFYKSILYDPDRSTIVNLGITGVPNTFVIDADGTVLYAIKGRIRKDEVQVLRDYIQ